MVQARLDAEGPEGKRVLRAAAVFGERFSRAGIASLLGAAPDDETIVDAIERLATHELIARAAQPLRQDDVEYVFAHALVREAAYAMLTDEDRQLGHRLAGAWLEQAGAGDAMVLADHFRRGGEPARAVPWYERAAAQALAANDLGAAIERAEAGVQGGAVGDTIGRLRLVQAESHVWRGELAQAEARALEAAAALPWGGVDWFRARGQAIIAAAKRGSLEVVEEQVRQIEAVDQQRGSRRPQRADHLPVLGGQLPDLRRAVRGGGSADGDDRQAGRRGRGAGSAGAGAVAAGARGARFVGGRSGALLDGSRGGVAGVRAGG